MDHDRAGETPDNVATSIRMLLAVIEGRTYDGVGVEFGITRTAVERRVKAVAARLSRDVGVDGLNEGGTAFVRRLRQRREAILAALERFEPQPGGGSRSGRVVTTAEIAQAALRIRGRSAQPWRDVALFYMLFVTGARPLEIARMRVGDYLGEDGAVRRESELPAEASITGRPRPLFFASRKLDDALDAYLRERVERQQGIGASAGHRGLAAHSRLFLTPAGQGFRITQYGKPCQRRFLCRPILETYRKLFRYAELEGATALSMRHALASRLYDRGADDEQVGLVLGISERSAVRELFPRSRPTMASLVAELV